MPLKTTKTLPPGGWPFKQQTKDGTIKKFEFMGPFGDAVRTICDYRKGNGITPNDVLSVELELEQYTCERLGNDPRWCDVKKKLNLLQKAHVLPAHVLQVVKRAGDAATGARILADWLGEGAKPVPIALAQVRADVCTGRLSGTPCPQNLESHGVMKMTDRIAEAILEQRRKKSDMELTVQGESEAFTCSVCSCHLALKFWVPMETIMGRTDVRLLEKFPDFCWMRTENKPKETVPETPPTP